MIIKYYPRTQKYMFFSYVVKFIFMYNLLVGIVFFLLSVTLQRFMYTVMNTFQTFGEIILQPGEAQTHNFVSFKEKDRM